MANLSQLLVDATIAQRFRLQALASSSITENVCLPHFFKALTHTKPLAKTNVAAGGLVFSCCRALNRLLSSVQMRFFRMAVIRGERLVELWFPDNVAGVSKKCKAGWPPAWLETAARMPHPGCWSLRPRQSPLKRYIPSCLGGDGA